MARFLVMVFVVACWNGAQPRAGESTTSPPSPAEPRREVGSAPVCVRFDIADPACGEACPRDAPDDWSGWGACEKHVTELVARGYTCSTPNPWKCTRVPPSPPPRATCPAGGCVAVKARILNLAIQGDGVMITFGAGAQNGVTKAWRATLVDGDVPVPNGEITIRQVEIAVTKGLVKLTPDQIKRSHVRIEP